MPRNFTATITNPDRAEEWGHVLGTTTLFIESPIPHVTTLPGHAHALVYRLDVDELTATQLADLIGYLACKFDLSKELVESSLAAEGMPILADDCRVTVHNTRLL
jgi:hypothetical protein